MNNNELDAITALDTDDFLKNMPFIEKMYDSARYVDPIRKKTISIENREVRYTDKNCYGIWEKSAMCENCISIRAINEGKTFVKIDYSTDRIYMVTSVPVNISGQKIVLELLKDVTGSMLITGEDLAKHPEIYAMLDNLNNMALKDALSDVFNRRYINEKMPVDIINSVLLGQQLSVIITDIDYFKKVNDQYGHVAGDFVIKEFAQTLTGCITRSSDWVARYGGEEFLICLPAAGLELAAVIAGRMREAVEAKSFECFGKVIKITSSFGIACMTPPDNKTLEEILSEADGMLYKAKGNGRNRVEF